MEMSSIWDWFPIVFFPLKILVLGTGMFYAIKWHYDQGKKGQTGRAQTRAVLRAVGKAAGVFAVMLLLLLLFTFFLSDKLGLNLSTP